MKKVYLLFFSIFLITACSSDKIKDVERVELFYWETKVEKAKNEFFDNENTVDMFVESVNNAEELDGKQIIKTKPLLSFSLGLKDDITKKYHLWITEDGEGYIQGLLPDSNGTFKLDNQSVATLIKFFKEKENVRLISGAIEFEKND
ncbi:hypothetical protein LCL95_07820 [Bacillus timonensis]|nr:hypothetical protein [Bacillus timonensis]